MAKHTNRCRDSFRDTLWDNRNMLCLSLTSGCADCAAVAAFSLLAVGWEKESFLTACLFNDRVIADLGA